MAYSTFMLGGQETTTSALARLLHVLAQEQDADVVAQAAGAARERGGACMWKWGLTMRGSSWRTWTSSVRVALVSI